MREDVLGDAPAPLRGLRIVDLSTHLPGPFATARLRAYGATVLKVEPPGGDPARHMFRSTIFDEVNVGKRSMVLDLRDEDQRRTVRALCRTADVIVEGFRPSIADRLRVSPADLWDDPRGGTARLFVSIRASSEDEVFASGRAHDVNVVARSGLMMVPVTWSLRGQLPLRPAVPLADIAAAEEVTREVLAWAVQRAGGTASGVTHVTVGMLESLRPWVRIREVTFDDGRATHLDPANDVYVAADGRWLSVTALEDPAWQRMCRLLPLPEDVRERLAGMTAPDRLDDGDAVARSLRDAIANEPASHWLEVLTAAGVSIAEVLPPRTSGAEAREGVPILGDVDPDVAHLADPWSALEA